MSGAMIDDAINGPMRAGDAIAMAIGWACLDVARWWRALHRVDRYVEPVVHREPTAAELAMAMAAQNAPPGSLPWERDPSMLRPMTAEQAARYRGPMPARDALDLTGVGVWLAPSPSRR